MGSEGARFGAQGQVTRSPGGVGADARPRRAERRNAAIVARYLEGESFATIGLSIGLTRERVRQIVKASGAVMPSEVRCAVPGCAQTPRAPNAFCYEHRTRLKRDATASSPKVALLKDEHGTYASYRDRRCRCDLCRKASADRRRAQFHRVHPEWRYRSKPGPPA
jgi:hypothetical protein